MYTEKQRPYEGGEPYLFASYAGADASLVMPILETMMTDGYRIWFDEARPVEGEWPENVAQHLKNSTAILLVVTRNSIEAPSFIRDINFAMTCQKPMISIFLEEVPMPLGMQMMLSASQVIYRYVMRSDKDLYDTLLQIDNVRACKGAPVPQQPVIPPQPPVPPAPSAGVAAGLTFCMQCGAKVSTEYKLCIKCGAPMHHEYAAQPPAGNEWENPAPAGNGWDAAAPAGNGWDNPAPAGNGWDNPAPAGNGWENPAPAGNGWDNPAPAGNGWDNQGYVGYAGNGWNAPAAATGPYVIRREGTGEEMILTQGECVIGRSESDADFVINGNKTIGRRHARITVQDGLCTITDLDSLNKTKVNGTPLEPNVVYELNIGDSITLSNEQFQFYRRER